MFDLDARAFLECLATFGVAVMKACIEILMDGASSSLSSSNHRTASQPWRHSADHCALGLSKTACFQIEALYGVACVSLLPPLQLRQVRFDALQHGGLNRYTGLHLQCCEPPLHLIREPH